MARVKREDYKRCAICEQWKLRSSFSKDKYKKDGLSHRCKQCRSEHHQVHREEEAEAYKIYQANHRDEILARGKAWYYAHKEQSYEQHAKWYQENRELVLAKCKIYRENLSLECKAKKAARRRRVEKQATPPWVNFDEIAPFYEKAIRLTEETGKRYHVDHMVPLTSKVVCGLHAPANLQVLLGSENARKHNRYWPDM